MENKKVAVVLFNLGGPDQISSVKPFLFNLFNDRAIIGLPQPFRWLLAKFISGKREKFAQEIYEKIGGKSPILELTKEQASALEKNLNEPRTTNHEPRNKYEVFVTMRYWYPRATEIVRAVKKYAPDKIILLPLYPQYSTTTTQSSFDEWDDEADKEGLAVKTVKICCYSKNSNFIRAHAALVREEYIKAQERGNPLVLFSAHGLPEKIIKSGDPYQFHVERTARAIVEVMNVKELDWKVCYQSKVGRLKWLEPSTEVSIIEAAEQKIPLVIVPIAFVSEHSETLVELDIEYKKLAEGRGLGDYFRVPALGVHKLFISALAEICEKAVNSESSIISWEEKRVCPAEFGRCPCLIALDS